MSETVIKVENLGKKYIIGHQKQERYTALRDVITNGVKSIFTPNSNNKTTQEEFWALNDVSFEIKQGDRVGIIGRNGAGKSTLLKILSRITEPTKGRINIKGRVASLLEVGTGFHPELTGRENIFLNGAILGMSKAEIKKKFDEIVAFAEVEKFLDTPVKRYSSGMYVRLAFAVAAHLEPEILLVDEVLAVGDAAFQKKCLNKMNEVSLKEEKTIIFVSHNMAAIKALCSNAILLNAGKLKLFGNLENILSAYLSLGNINPYTFEISFPEIKTKAQVQKISINTQPKEDYAFSYLKDIQIQIDCEFREPISNAYLGINILNQYQEPLIFWRDFELIPELMDKKRKGKYTYFLNIPGETLVPGSYSICVALVDQTGYQHLHIPDENLLFQVKDYDSIRQVKGLTWKGMISRPLKLVVNDVTA